MGSYAKATMTGFICRLCSDRKKFVIHLYSSQAKKHKLMEKIKLLPVKVEKYDNLPKTICDKCIENLNSQYQLVNRFRKSIAIQRNHRLFHSNGRCPVECPLHGIVDSPSPERSETSENQSEPERAEAIEQSELPESLHNTKVD